jgi:iron complex outermembrane recepter protein
LGRGVLPVINSGRICDRAGAFRCLVIATAAAAALLATAPGRAQTAPPPAQVAQNQRTLPAVQIEAPRKKPQARAKKPGGRLSTTTAPPSPGDGPANGQALPGVAPATPLNTNVVAASATRLGLTVFQTPATVQVVSQQTMQEQGYRTTTDTAQAAVGVLAGDSAGAPANFSMRGFSGSQVNVLYNGIWTGPSDITARWMGTANLQQVEFLQGPSSLMSGLNAIGGSVNYVSWQPITGPIRNELDLSLDSFGSPLAHLGSGGSTTVAGVDYRFDATGSRFNSFIDGDFRKLTDLSGQVNDRVTDTFKTFVAAEYKTDSGHAYWGTPLVPVAFAGPNAVNGVVSGTASGTFAPSVIGPLGPLTIDSRTLTTNYNVADNATGAKEVWLRGGFEWTPRNDVTVKNQVYYYKVQSNWIDSETYAFDNATAMIAQDRFAVSHDQKMIGDNTDLVWDSRLFGMDNRFAAQLQLSSNKITFKQFAGDYPSATEIAVVDPVPSTFGPVAFDTLNSRLDDVAMAFEDRLKITSALALIGGVRLDDLTLTRDKVLVDGTVPDGFPFTTSWKPVSYRAAYTYEPIRDLMFYSMFATAYNPAAAALFSVTPAQTTLLTSSRLYETGAKQLFWDGNAEWTIAAYDIRQRNVFVPVNTTTTDVAGEVKSQGVEVAAAVRPFDGWKLWGNAAYTHARFVNFDVWSGNAPPNVAPLIVNAGASYRFNHWRWPVELGGTLRHVGNRFLEPDDLTTLDAYTTADVYAFVDIPGWDLARPEIDNLRVTFRVRNLTNKIYAAWSDTTYPDQVLLGAPRTYEVAASARW